MNRERILNAIEVMKDAKTHQSLQMSAWQTGFDANLPRASTLDELHACGSKACFAGHLACTSGWKEAGYRQGGKGNPLPPHGSAVGLSSNYVAMYLDISEGLADSLVYGETTNLNWSNFYGCAWREVTPDMVIEKLELILSGELS